MTIHVYIPVMVLEGQYITSHLPLPGKEAI